VRNSSGTALSPASTPCSTSQLSIGSTWTLSASYDAFVLAVEVGATAHPIEEWAAPPGRASGDSACCGR